jgi:hypothetical protein
VSDPLTEVLCPGVISQPPSLRGAEEAGALAASTLTAAGRLHFDRHYFAFHALRTMALLALERHDLAAAAEPVERRLEIVSGARPAFNLPGSAGPGPESGRPAATTMKLRLAPAARSALKSENSVLLAGVDELEARIASVSVT